MLFWPRLLLCGAALLVSLSAHSQPWTLSATIQQARTASPEARAIAAALPGMRQAVQLARDPAVRPSLQALAGPSLNPDLGPGADLTLAWPLEAGGKADARTAVARSRLEGDEASLELARTEAAVRAAEAWLRAIRARDDSTLQRKRREVAEQLFFAAESLRQAGSVAALEVHLAQSELARARAAEQAAIAERASALASLAYEIGLPQGATVDVVGALDDAHALAERTTPGVDQRPDVVQARAEGRVAEAEIAAARAASRQDVAAFLRYGLSGGTHDVQAGVELPLPFQIVGRAAIAEAVGRRAATTERAVAAVRRAEAEVAASRDRWLQLRQAVQRLEREGRPAAVEVDRLLGEGQARRQLDVRTVLLLRREVQELARDLLDRQLDAALAAIRLWQAKGAP